MRKRSILFILFGLGLLLAGCGAQSSGANIPSTNPTTPATATMIPTEPMIPTVEVTINPSATAVPTADNMDNQATSQPAGTPTSGSAASGTSTEPAGATPVGITLQPDQPVTLANKGQTIRMQVGADFVLMLGNDYDWQVTVANQGVVSRVVNITPLRGSQGVYHANARGTTTLTATGDPPCRSATPPCGQPSVVFEITLVVE